VTVWNHTIEKAQPLVENGATLARTSMNAVRASPVVLVRVDNCAILIPIFESSTDVLADRTIIELTSDTGTRAEEMAAWAPARGAGCLDGVTLAYPSPIGSGEAAILIAGCASAWEVGESLLRDVAGGTTSGGDNALAGPRRPAGTRAGHQDLSVVIELWR
jgi:3-hydroxyisobutyrate dehydrogenase-like beta-hydroxyacid dehydrogenase